MSEVPKVSPLQLQLLAVSPAPAVEGKRELHARADSSAYSSTSSISCVDDPSVDVDLRCEHCLSVDAFESDYGRLCELCAAKAEADEDADRHHDDEWTPEMIERGGRP